jgi:hypothetical protein
VHYNPLAMLSAPDVGQLLYPDLVLPVSEPLRFLGLISHHCLTGVRIAVLVRRPDRL